MNENDDMVVYGAANGVTRRECHRGLRRVEGGRRHVMSSCSAPGSAAADATQHSMNILWNMFL